MQFVWPHDPGFEAAVHGGVFNARKNKRGDQIVEVMIQAPPTNDERTRELLRELAKLHTEDPRAEIWSKV